MEFDPSLIQSLRETLEFLAVGKATLILMSLIYIMSSIVLVYLSKKWHFRLNWAGLQADVVKLILGYLFVLLVLQITIGNPWLLDGYMQTTIGLLLTYTITLWFLNKESSKRYFRVFYPNIIHVEALFKPELFVKVATKRFEPGPRGVSAQLIYQVGDGHVIEFYTVDISDPKSHLVAAYRNKGEPGVQEDNTEKLA